MVTVIMGSPTGGNRVSIMGPDLSCFPYAHNGGLRHHDMLLPVSFLCLWCRGTVAVKRVLRILGILRRWATLLSEWAAVGCRRAGRHMTGLSRGEVFLAGRQVLIGAAVWRVSASSTSHIFETSRRVRPPGPGEKMVVTSSMVSHSDPTVATFSWHYSSDVNTSVWLEIWWLPWRRWWFGPVWSRSAVARTGFAIFILGVVSASAFGRPSPIDRPGAKITCSKVAWKWMKWPFALHLHGLVPKRANFVRDLTVVDFYQAPVVMELNVGVEWFLLAWFSITGWLWAGPFDSLKVWT